MKYTHEPNVTVMDFIKVKKIFQFDDKGEFETEDKNIIEFMAKYKSFIKCEENEIEIIKEVEEVKINGNIKEEIKIIKCKKCDFETDNKGELLAHYRKDHKKK